MMSNRTTCMTSRAACSGPTRRSGQQQSTPSSRRAKSPTVVSPGRPAPFPATRSPNVRATRSPSPPPPSRSQGLRTAPRSCVAAVPTPQVGSSVHPVAAFLRKSGLQMYSQQFLRNGFDEVETLLELEDADLKDFRMPPHHVARLQKSLRELRQRVHAEQLQASSRNPVAVFLKEHGLGQHAASLLAAGFDDMETLYEIEDADLKDLGFPRGHSLKLRRHLRELRHEGRPEEQLERLPSSASRLRPCATPEEPVAAPSLDPTEQMKTDVIRSWETVSAIGTLAVGEILYRHTFELAPEARGLFPPEVLARYRQCRFDDVDSDLRDSAALGKLFSTVLNSVGSAVAGLRRDMGGLVSMLTQLGARHINYGVAESCFPVLEKALMMTLRDILEDSFTQEVEHSWTIVYRFISGVLVQGMKGAQAALDARRAAEEEERRRSTQQVQEAQETFSPERPPREKGLGDTGGSEDHAVASGFSSDSARSAGAEGNEV